MSRINVDIIAGVGGTHVQLLSGASGDASRLTFIPNIISFSPNVLANNVSIDSNIVFTFNQNIQFTNPAGTIELRSGSPTGSLVESYTTGSSARLTIAANTLTIDPTSDLSYDTTYFVVLPSVGIANTFGAPYPGSSSYQFRTTPLDFEITGGTHVFTRIDPASPTGYYKYHVFTGTGSMVLNKPSPSAVDLSYLLVAGGGSGGNGYSPGYAGGGGGGAGGVISGTGPEMGLTGPKTYTVTIGSGGANMPYTSQPSPSYDGIDSTITSPTGTHFTAIGGGNGGGYSSLDNAHSGGSGGGGGGQPHPTQPSYPGIGHLSWPGGSGTPTQGNPGGYGASGYTPSAYMYVGGGGGGSGTAGQNAPYPTYPPAQWPTTAGSPVWNATGGNGGNGTPVTAFAGQNLAGYVPSVPYTTLLDAIGPIGRYGGGGGGGAPLNTSYTRAGAGGLGGGGHGATVTPNPPNPSPFGPKTPTQYNAQDGYQYTGGGGGGGTSPNPSAYTNGAGGSGVFMVRYAVPLSLT